jgi:hypothetical protein
VILEVLAKTYMDMFQIDDPTGQFQQLFVSNLKTTGTVLESDKSFVTPCSTFSSPHTEECDLIDYKAEAPDSLSDLVMDIEMEHIEKRVHAGEKQKCPSCLKEFLSKGFKTHYNSCRAAQEATLKNQKSIRNMLLTSSKPHD